MRVARSPRIVAVVLGALVLWAPATYFVIHPWLNDRVLQAASAFVMADGLPEGGRVRRVTTQVRPLYTPGNPCALVIDMTLETSASGPDVLAHFNSLRWNEPIELEHLSMVDHDTYRFDLMLRAPHDFEVRCHK